MCIKIGCIQNEVVCSTTVGQISTTECTRYFRQCNYGEWGVPQEVAIGTYCYRGVQVNAATCNQRGGNTCSFTGIRCVDGDENVITTQCSSYYQQCINGVTSNIIGTTDGTSCYQGALIDSSDCPSQTCSFDKPACVTNQGQIVTNSYTNSYVTCNEGILSYPFPVGPGVQCYNGNGVISPGQNPPEGDTSCSFTGIRCVNPEGQFVDHYCVEQYRRCVDGKLSAVLTVDQGMICNSGEIQSCENCQCLAPIHRCSFVGIQCVTEFGFVIFVKYEHL